MPTNAGGLDIHRVSFRCCACAERIMVVGDTLAFCGGTDMTIDRWDTEADFENFQRDFGIQYRGLDEELEGVAGEEVFVGAFEE